MGSIGIYRDIDSELRVLSLWFFYSVRFPEFRFRGRGGSRVSGLGLLETMLLWVRVA